MDKVPPPLTLGESSYWLLHSPGPDLLEFAVPFLARVFRRDPGDREMSFAPYGPSGRGRPAMGAEHLGGDSPETAIYHLLRRYPGYVAETPTLLPGQHYPRVWRNGRSHAENTPRAGRAYPQSLVLARRRATIAVRRLLDALAEVFEVIEPHANNHNAFGAAIRQLLILACTEVEASWVGVLRANGGARDRMNTNDYVRLRDPLRLREYEVSLPLYSEAWTSIAPFQAWSPTAATASLPWYEAYNATKHNAEDHGHVATLDAAVHAVAAGWILLVAQFGTEAPDLRGALEHRLAFHLQAEPRWLPNELYFPADERGFEPVPLFGSRPATP